MQFAPVVVVGVAMVGSGCGGARRVSTTSLVAHANELREGTAATIDDVTVQPFQQVEVIDSDGAHRIAVSELLHDCPAGREMQTPGCLLSRSSEIVVERAHTVRTVALVTLAIVVVVAFGLTFAGDAP